MTSTETKPLQPLQSGTILIVGAKASNFDNEIRQHPRVTMWDSQNEHWINKDIPSNTKAVFITKWIGHVAFGNILEQARKRQITLFNTQGTGMIVKQVKELLSLTPILRPEPVWVEPIVQRPEPQPEPVTATVSEETPVGKPGIKPRKLHPLLQFIDWNKTNVENAHILMAKGKSMGITSTMASLANFVGLHRRKQGGRLVPKRLAKEVEAVPVDVSVEILDNVIKDLQGIRQYIVDTTKENASLRARLERFKKFLEE